MGPLMQGNKNNSTQYPTSKNKAWATRTTAHSLLQAVVSSQEPLQRTSNIYLCYDRASWVQVAIMYPGSAGLFEVVLHVSHEVFHTAVEKLQVSIDNKAIHQSTTTTMGHNNHHGSQPPPRVVLKQETKLQSKRTKCPSKSFASHPASHK
jgi:hypothetical protein